VAVYAKHQWAIRKATSARRTTTTITPLRTDDERLEELATMLRGEARSDTTRREAGEMLTAARKKW
jgi:DNA repair protein RecN (Recombination protein N)